MQRPEGKAALGQVRVENGQSEREGAGIGAHALHLRQLAPQGGYDLGTVLVSVERHERWAVAIIGKEQCRTKIEQCKNYQPEQPLVSLQPWALPSLVLSASKHGFAGLIRPSTLRTSPSAGRLRAGTGWMWAIYRPSVSNRPCISRVPGSIEE
jgi:hypothetical protein